MSDEKRLSQADAQRRRSEEKRASQVEILAATKERIKLVFKRYDRDGNGILSRQEIQKLMHAMGGAVSKEEVDKVYDEIDSNGDDQVVIEEFVEWVMQPGCRMQVQENGEVMDFDLILTLRPLFQVYDTDHNGSINLEEFKELHSILQGAIHLHFSHTSVDGEYIASDIGAFEEAERVFEEADENRDKKISLEEFVDWQRDAIHKAAISKDRFVELVAKLSALMQSLNTVSQAFGMRDEKHPMRKDMEKITSPLKEQIAEITSELYAGDETDAGRERTLWEALPAHICKRTLLRAHLRIPVPTYNVAKIDFSVFPCVPAQEKRRRLGLHQRWLAKVVRRVEHKPASPKKSDKKPEAIQFTFSGEVTPKNKTPKAAKSKAKNKDKEKNQIHSRSSTETIAEHELSAHNMLHEQGAEITVTEHFYSYEENMDGVLQWKEARSKAEYAEAQESLTPELKVLAIILTEANFQNVHSWSSILQPALSLANDFVLISLDKVAEFRQIFEAFAESEIAKTYTGFENLSDELKQSSIEKFLEEDLNFTPLEMMSVLTDTGLVPAHQIWKDHETLIWKDFKATNPLVLQGVTEAEMGPGLTFNTE